jgi:hypothetical protein
LWTLEYFAGLEFMRALVIWIIIAEGENDLRLTQERLDLRLTQERLDLRRRRRVLLTLRSWWPYLAVVVAFTVWRLFFLNVGSTDPNEPTLLNNLLIQPLSTGVRLFQFALQDFLNVIFGAWTKTLRPEVFDLTDRLVLFSGLLSLLVFALTAFYLNRLKRQRITMGTPQSCLGGYDLRFVASC